jgi:hypothetical protein
MIIGPKPEALSTAGSSLVSSFYFQTALLPLAGLLGLCTPVRVQVCTLIRFGSSSLVACELELLMHLRAAE